MSHDVSRHGMSVSVRKEVLKCKYQRTSLLIQSELYFCLAQKQLRVLSEYMSVRMTCKLKEQFIISAINVEIAQLENWRQNVHTHDLLLLQLKT